LGCKPKERKPQLDSGLHHTNTNCGLLALADTCNNVANTTQGSPRGGANKHSLEKD